MSRQVAADLNARYPTQGFALRWVVSADERGRTSVYAFGLPHRIQDLGGYLAGHWGAEDVSQKRVGWIREEWTFRVPQ